MSDEVTPAVFMRNLLMEDLRRYGFSENQVAALMRHVDSVARDLAPPAESTPPPTPIIPATPPGDTSNFWWLDNRP